MMTEQTWIEEELSDDAGHNGRSVYRSPPILFVFHIGAMIFECLPSLLGKEAKRKKDDFPS